MTQTPLYQKVIFKERAQSELLKGARTLASAVSSTMGPSGHSVIIDNEHGSPIITKDGVTVAKSINLRDRLQSMGADLLKEVASKTNELGGDGTSTATVLGYHLLKEGNKMISAGRSSIAIKNGMDKATEIVLQFLKEKCIPIAGREDIINVGTISANGDQDIGTLIADAIEKVGSDGLIAVEPAKSVKTTLSLAEGIQINGGFVSPFFITNNDKQICELENPYVLITAGKISTMNDIIPVLEQIDRVSRPLLIVADEVEGEALHTLVVNKTNQVIQVCAVKAPSYGEHRADLLADLSIVVDGIVIGATSEISLKNVKLANLGRCKRVIVDRKSTTFLVNNEGNEASVRIRARADEIRNALVSDHTLDELRLSKFRERLARLSGGIAVIQVGGSTEVEIKEKKDRVEDAVNATQAAVQEGIVPGGGLALLYAAEHLRNILKARKRDVSMGDEEFGYDIIANVCESPFRTIISNTGKSPDVVMAKLLERPKTVHKIDVSNIHRKELQKYIDSELETIVKLNDQFDPFKFGYNAYTHEYEDLIKSGVIDPVKVTRLALEHAVSAIGLTLTCNAVILHEDDPNVEK